MNEVQFLKNAIFQLERLAEISEANTARAQSMIAVLKDRLTQAGEEASNGN